MRRTKQGLMPCEEEKPKSTEKAGFSAGSYDFCYPTVLLRPFMIIACFRAVFPIPALSDIGTCFSREAELKYALPQHRLLSIGSLLPKRKLSYVDLPRYIFYQEKEKKKEHLRLFLRTVFEI